MSVGVGPRVSDRGEVKPPGQPGLKHRRLAAGGSRRGGALGRGLWCPVRSVAGLVREPRPARVGRWRQSGLGWPAAKSSRLRRASMLEEENEQGERGKRHRSSQRVQRWPRRARGGTGASRASRGSSGGRRWKRRRWRRFRCPAGASFGLVKR